MILREREKDEVKRALAAALSHEDEVRRIVVFGSFLDSDNPHDIDVAVFQDSNEKYLPLALRYRRDVRAVSCKIPIDIVPLKADVTDDPFLKQIEKGETIYEK